MAAEPKINWTRHEWGSSARLVANGHLIMAQVSASMVEGLTWEVSRDGKRFDAGDDYSGGSGYADAEAAIRRAAKAG